MTKRASIIKQASARLTSLCAYGESRHDLKRALRDDAEAATGRRPWTQSTGRIHSLNTQGAYWRVARDYVEWARSTYDVRDLDDLDTRADELVHAYLEHKQRNGKEDGSPYSPYSLQQIRAALRLFYTVAHPDARTLGANVSIGRRRRGNIANNRGESTAYSRRHVNLDNYRPLVDFLRATGLRRREVAALRVHDVEVRRDAPGDVAVSVHVTNGKGGRERLVTPEGDHTPLAVLVGGREGKERVFARIPAALRIQALRREFAQRCYLAHADSDHQYLPPAEGRLRPGSYDREAAAYVSRQLGHNRVDVVLRHYLR